MTLGFAIAALTGISGSASVGTAGAERSGAGMVGGEIPSLNDTTLSSHLKHQRPKCSDARRGLAFYRARHAQWLKMRGAGSKRVAPEVSSRQPRTPRNCADAGYLAGVWRLRARRARDAYQRWYERHFQLTAHNTWREAVVEVQKAYPGTAWWLMSCAASEGGYGRWVPNSQGSGVGGWLQFYPSTFWRMFSAAQTDSRGRGFRVPRSAASWYSPLGQALAGAWGLTHGRRHEWHGAGC